MNELKGKFVNIVLTIDEGRGFDALNLPVFFSANFNGRIMESDHLVNSANPIFNTEMVWETEKKFLRKVRTENKPIRMDWFTSDLKFIGFNLVHLRSAQILPSSSKNLKIVYSWLKLLNIPKDLGSRVSMEVKLSITIRDYLINRVLPPAVPNIIRPDEEDCRRIPIIRKDDFIKIGDVQEKLNKYHFKILVREVKNLDVLLPETMVFSQVPKIFYLKFLIFGIEVKTRDITRDLHKNFEINETIVINVLTNPEIIEMYFKNYPTILVNLYNGDFELGTTEIQVNKMSWNENGRIFHEEESFFEALDISLNGNIERRASLETVCSFEILSENGQGDMETISPRVRYSSGIEGEKILNKYSNEKKNGLKKQINSVTYDVSLKENINKLPPIEEIKANDKYQVFTVGIIFESIAWTKSLKKTDICFKLFHPFGSSRLEIRTKVENSRGGKIILDNAICKLYILCARSRITPILHKLFPALQILDGTTEAAISREHPIPCKVSMSEPELSQILTLMSHDDCKLGELSYWVMLEVNDLKPLINTPYDLRPVIVDDYLVFQSINEIESWKLQERTNYSAELVAEKKIVLESFNEDWAERKNELENDLKTNLEQCKKLSSSLETVVHKAKLEHKILELKEQKELTYDLTLHKNMITYSLSDNVDLIEKITSSEIEFGILKELCVKTKTKLLNLKKSAITGDQAKNLLLEMKNIQEQNEDLKKDKSYFKNEWEKAMKEVHELKLQLQKNLQDKLADDKLKLSQLSLDSFAT